MKVALFTPWPPQKSGIADYAYGLARGLIARGVEVIVLTSATAPLPLASCTVEAGSQDLARAIPGDALPIFQLGNNITFHAFQPAYLARLGGLVHLHDPVLHHFHVDRTLSAGVGGYWDDLDHWYGRRVAKACQRLLAVGSPPWSNAAVATIPFFEPYLQHADAVLAHSATALRSINERLPGLRGYELPQCYAIAPPAERGRARFDAPLRLGVFGFIEPHKRVDQVLAAVANVRAQGAEVSVEICGPAGATMRDLPARVAALGLERTVRLRGHLGHEELRSAIASVDLCVNLRDPTMGETSAIVVQALQLGTPVVASDVGWYAELPPCVLKVPAGPAAVAALAGHLLRLNAHRDELDTLAEATRRYAATNLDYDAIMERYVEIIGELSRERNERRAIDRDLYRDVARALAELELADSGAEAAIGAGLIRALSACLV